MKRRKFFNLIRRLFLNVTKTEPRHFPGPDWTRSSILTRPNFVILQNSRLKWFQFWWKAVISVCYLRHEEWKLYIWGFCRWNAQLTSSFGFLVCCVWDFWMKTNTPRHAAVVKTIAYALTFVRIWGKNERKFLILWMKHFKFFWYRRKTTTKAILLFLRKNLFAFTVKDQKPQKQVFHSSLKCDEDKFVSWVLILKMKYLHHSLLKH